MDHGRTSPRICSDSVLREKNWVIDIGNLHNPHLVILVATFPILVKPVPETEFIWIYDVHVQTEEMPRIERYNGCQVRSRLKQKLAESEAARASAEAWASERTPWQNLPYLDNLDKLRCWNRNKCQLHSSFVNLHLWYLCLLGNGFKPPVLSFSPCTILRHHVVCER